MASSGTAEGWPGPTAPWATADGAASRAPGAPAGESAAAAVAPPPSVLCLPPPAGAAAASAPAA
eukprot:8501362-Lingulodinium_polyedra.AAC.1